MKDRIKENLTLAELVTGILLLSLIAEIVLLIAFPGKRFSYSISLLVGMMTSIWMAIHMLYSIKQALDYDEGSAKKLMQRSSMVRYAMAVFVISITGLSSFFNVIVVFIGIIFLKFSAYMQPFLHGPMVKIFGELPPGPSLPEEDEDEKEEQSNGGI